MKHRQRQDDFDQAEARRQWLIFLESLDSDIDPLTVRLMEQLRQVSHDIYQISEQSLARAELSFAQYRILMQLYFTRVVHGRDALNPSEISDRQGTSRNTVSALIRTLEESGYVARHLDQDDRRKFNIRITAEGEAIVRDNALRHLKTIEDCFGVLNSAEQETLLTLLTRTSQRTSAVRQQLANQPPTSEGG